MSRNLLKKLNLKSKQLQKDKRIRMFTSTSSLGEVKNMIPFFFISFFFDHIGDFLPSSLHHLPSSTTSLEQQQTHKWNVTRKGNVLDVSVAGKFLVVEKMGEIMD